jgi:hypothetical protein
MFRIIDNADGYEYRTNAAGKKLDRSCDAGFEECIESYGGGGYGYYSFPFVNFNLANGNNLSDLVGIVFWEKTSSSVDASPLVGASFGSDESILIFNQTETPASCEETVFTCAPGFLDKGIDDSLPNSKGQVNQVCDTNRLPSNTSGWLYMPFSGFVCSGQFFDEGCTVYPFFVGFIGLNNGDGTGSMDSWWATEYHYYYGDGI